MPVHGSALVEEVRVAIALNGGVSLAVWMGGCVVELDCARRAHLHPEAVVPENGEKPPDRTIYHALCSAFRRELVLDLMSGASAGGISGALLAAAIVHNRRLHPRFVRQRWVEVGDFGRALRATSQPDPPSLMDGCYFKRELKDVFDALVNCSKRADACLLRLSGDDAQALEGRTVALEVTATDVAGRERVFRDHWGENVVAREYRGRFSFREREDYTVERLTTAARSTASFPIAFEPSEVPAGMLPRVEGTRWVIDGGLLDNAPIRAVLDLIPSRPANRQVQRYVCYLNADPPVPSRRTRGCAAPMPGLENVVGYTLNLPRKVTFVDQLAAVERATQAGDPNLRTELSLLDVDLGALCATAENLLSTYRRRRRLLSLAELVAQPSEVEAVSARLDDHASELPWIPTTMIRPPPGRWGWGARPAQRVLHLLIDLVRHAAQGAPTNDRTALFELRSKLDAHIERIEGERRSIVETPDVRTTVAGLAKEPDVAAKIEELSDVMAKRDRTIRGAVEGAAGDVLASSALLAERADASYLKGLFGDDWEPAKAARGLTDARLNTFLRRTLAIEVVRRAFSDDSDFETGQRLRFAQLTPGAPARLFAPSAAWDTPDEKLTGIKLANFAAFYRASWRANDFMWGRLDAAVRIVDMLVDPARAEQVVADGGRPPADVLAKALLPEDATEDQRWLVAEELKLDPNAEDLRTQLAVALSDDLRDGGDRTRAICARAVQLEILIHELPIVVTYSEQDVRLGTSAPPLQLDTNLPWPETIERIRAGPTFPKRLGRDLQEEQASALAVRTSTHAVFVGLAALRATRRPLTGALYSLRAPLLPVAALVSTKAIHRMALVLAFWATALLVDSRLATARDDHPPVSIWSLPVVTTFLAVVGLLSIAAVPLWRAARAGSAGRRWVQLAWLAVLLAVGGGFGVVAGLVSSIGGDAILTQSGADAPPDPLLWLAIAATLALSARPPIPALVAICPWLAIGAFAGAEAAQELFDLDGWRSATAGLGLIGAPIALLAYMVVSERRLAARARRLRSRP
jgi:hypothetical protein